MSTAATPFRLGLIPQIVIGLLAGIVLALAWPGAGQAVGLLGTVFISALKAVAPVLVLVLVTAAVASQRAAGGSHIRQILGLYLVGTVAAALVAVAASFLFPTTLVLQGDSAQASAPSGIGQVLQTLLLQVFSNPVDARVNANYIGLLAWGVALGLALRQAGDTTRHVVSDLARAITTVVRWVIVLAPLGVFGIVASTLASSGLEVLAGYLQRYMREVAPK